jgi:hypothetical protein
MLTFEIEISSCYQELIMTRNNPTSLLENMALTYSFMSFLFVYIYIYVSLASIFL